MMFYFLMDIGYVSIFVELNEENFLNEPFSLWVKSLHLLTQPSLPSPVND